MEQQSNINKAVKDSALFSLESPHNIMGFLSRDHVLIMSFKQSFTSYKTKNQGINNVIKMCYLLYSYNHVQEIAFTH